MNKNVRQRLKTGPEGPDERPGMIILLLLLLFSLLLYDAGLLDS